MALLLVAGENWVRQSGRSPEWWDSWVIMLWVCVRVLRARTYDLYTFAGYREYVYGASWGRMVSQGYATYVRDALPLCFSVLMRSQCIGSDMVGRWRIGHLPCP